jgi:hypothetical protein
MLTKEGKEIRNVLSKSEDELLSKFYANFEHITRGSLENNVEQVLENLREI